MLELRRLVEVKQELLSTHVVRLEGRLALAVYPAEGAAPGAGSGPAYFILLTFEDGKVTGIRDFRYVPYIAAEAVFERV